jgi:glutamyl/glutaminyl-tRNA synthetase
MNRQTAQETVNAVVATLVQTLIDGHGINKPSPMVIWKSCGMQTYELSCITDDYMCATPLHANSKHHQGSACHEE